MISFRSCAFYSAKLLYLPGLQLQMALLFQTRSWSSHVYLKCDSSYCSMLAEESHSFSSSDLLSISVLQRNTGHQHKMCLDSANAQGQSCSFISDFISSLVVLVILPDLQYVPAKPHLHTATFTYVLTLQKQENQGNSKLRIDF